MAKTSLVLGQLTLPQRSEHLLATLSSLLMAVEGQAEMQVSPSSHDARSKGWTWSISNMHCSHQIHPSFFCMSLFSCFYKEILETGSFIKKRGLVGSEFCRLCKHGPGIYSVPGEASRSFDSWRKAKEEQVCHVVGARARVKEVPQPHTFNQISQELTIMKTAPRGWC